MGKLRPSQYPTKDVKIKSRSAIQSKRGKVGDKSGNSTLIRNKWGVIEISRSEKSNKRQDNCVRLRTIRDGNLGESKNNLGKIIKHPGEAKSRSIDNLVVESKLQQVIPRTE